MLSDNQIYDLFFNNFLVQMFDQFLSQLINFNRSGTSGYFIRDQRNEISRMTELDINAIAPLRNN